MFRRDPGPCAICGHAHTACTGASGPITVVQLPARDALPLTTQPREPPVELVPPPPAVEPQTLGDGSDSRPFSTATYRGKKRGPSSRS